MLSADHHDVVPYRILPVRSPHLALLPPWVPCASSAPAPVLSCAVGTIFRRESSIGCELVAVKGGCSEYSGRSLVKSSATGRRCWSLPLSRKARTGLWARGGFGADGATGCPFAASRRCPAGRP